MKSNYAPTPDDVWEWIEHDTLPGLRPATRIDYYRMINKVKADAWDGAIDAAMRQGTIQVPPNPHREED